MSATKLLSCCAAVCGLVCGSAAIASADTFTLTNTNSGDGFVTLIPGGFDLVGSNNGFPDEDPVESFTDYTATAFAAETPTFNWSYTTNDCCGSLFDPAGYIINGVRTQLSTDGNVQGQFDTSGILSFTLNAGDTYGFYVHTRDGFFGTADIAVTSVAATPIPAALPLFASALGGLGFVGWRRKNSILS